MIELLDDYSGIGFYRMKVINPKVSNRFHDTSSTKFTETSLHDKHNEDMDKDPFIESELVPLFKLEDGIANGSYGLNCAVKAGLGSSVVKRAQKVY